MVSIEVAGTTIEATAPHPIWVEQGEELERRPPVNDLEDGGKVEGSTGRWVAAANLRVGDELRLASGEEARVDAVAPWSGTLRVHNLVIADHHDFAVGPDGTLVHNCNFSAPPPHEPRRALGIQELGVSKAAFDNEEVLEKLGGGCVVFLGQCPMLLFSRGHLMSAIGGHMLGLTDLIGSNISSARYGLAGRLGPALAVCVRGCLVSVLKFCFLPVSLFVAGFLRRM